jgi:hypothetical protein
MSKIHSSVLSVLLVCSLAAGVRAQGGDGCPNVRATQVNAHVDHQGQFDRCGVGVQIFGLPIRIGGAKCYRHEYIYPAHQECLGAVSPGTLCDPEGPLPVEHNICKCLWLAAFGTGFGIPKCDCTYAGTAGTVQDATTGLCHGTP